MGVGVGVGVGAVAGVGWVRVRVRVRVRVGMYGGGLGEGVGGADPAELAAGGDREGPDRLGADPAPGVPFALDHLGRQLREPRGAGRVAVRLKR